MLLQERIEDLDSGIINVCNNIIKLTGFMSKARLLDYYNEGLDCRFSMGVYPKQNFDVAYIKDNGLFIILEDDKEIVRYSFRPIKKDIINFKDDEGNKRSKLFTIRKCSYTHKLNYKDMEESLIFNLQIELNSYLFNKYSYILE